MNYQQHAKSTIAAGTLLLLCISTVMAQQTVQKFIQETQYLLSLPQGYSADTMKRWPLMIFLHGSGERGTDIEKVKTHGPPKLIAAGKQFPFIVVSPQAIPPFGWETESLYHLLLSIKQTYRVDDERVYLTGLSMGGFGTWALAMKHPRDFAAIIPICGGGDTTDAWKLRHIPIWGFHGALDEAVPVAKGQAMINAAERYNPAVKFTIYPEVYHNSWDKAYDNDSLYQWMLAQKKFSYAQIAIAASGLKKYTGTYVNTEKDTIVILIENDTLKAKITKRVFPLKPAGNNIFFVHEQMPVDLRFIFSVKGKIEALLIMADQKTLYRKI